MTRAVRQVQVRDYRLSLTDDVQMPVVSPYPGENPVSTRASFACRVRATLRICFFPNVYRFVRNGLPHFDYAGEGFIAMTDPKTRFSCLATAAIARGGASMRSLVSGAAGFIGSHLAERLIRDS